MCPLCPPIFDERNDPVRDEQSSRCLRPLTELCWRPFSCDCFLCLSAITLLALGVNRASPLSLWELLRLHASMGAAPATSLVTGQLMCLSPAGLR